VPLAAGASVLLGAYLGLSGVGKLLNPAGFARVLHETYGLAPARARVLAAVVPVSEVASAALIVLPDTRTLGLLASTAWLCAVTLVVAVSWARGADGKCGCLGVFSRDDLSAWTLGRATGFAGMACFLFLLRLGL
jgi:hypothetical protein